MKILIITHAFIPDMDGGIIVAYNYAKELVALGHDVTVLSKKYETALEGECFKHIMLPGKYPDRLYICEFKHYFKTFDFSSYDKIILNQYPTSIIAGKFFSKELLLKCIPIIQGMEVEEVYKNKSCTGYLFYHLLMRTHIHHKRCMMLCNKVVSVSAAHREKVIRAAGLEKYRDNFQVVYTGIDKEVFHTTTTDFRATHNIAEDKQILVTVGRVVQMKGFDEMLLVFEQLYAKDKSFVWVIAGDGDYLATVKQKVNTLGLSDAVLCLGRFPNNRLKEIYSAADCFWLLSNYDECLPLVYLEAQACGVPAIGRNKGGVVETIEDKKTGFLVNSEQECYELLVNKAYLKLNKDDMLAFANTFDKIKATKELIQ